MGSANLFDLAKRDLTFGRNRKARKAYEVRLQEEDVPQITLYYFVPIYTTFLINKEIKIFFILYMHIYSFKILLISLFFLLQSIFVDDKHIAHIYLSYLYSNIHIYSL